MKSMKRCIIATALCISSPLLALEEATKDRVTTAARNVIKEASEKNTARVLTSEAKSLASYLVNQEVDRLEERATDTTNFTHIEVDIGIGDKNIDEKDSVSIEATLVYRLLEQDDLFVFNQTSFNNFDGRNTLNLGLGARKIFSDDTVIIGANTFYDREFGSGHERGGLGVEFMTSRLELRANKYKALSGDIRYQGGIERALDGHDVKLTANLPYMYSSNVFTKQSRFTDGNTYKTRTDEWGIQAELYPNLYLTVANQDRNGSSDQVVGSLRYAIPLGRASETAKTWQTGEWSNTLTPIRDKLYKPVERENRILKSKSRLGVTVSGY